MTRTFYIGGYPVTLSELLRDALVATFVILPAFVLLCALAAGMEPVR